MPKMRPMQDDLEDEIEELLENNKVVGHKAKGGFPFKGEGSKKKALDQLRKMKEEEEEDCD